MKIVSACLAGIKCRYDKKSNANDKVIHMVANGEAIPLCAEQFGGLRTPRIGNGILDRDGHDVLSGKAKVMNRNQKDVTKQFVSGAEEVLRIAKLVKAKEAILKQGSPSCGCGKTYRWIEIDGKLRNKKRDGDGVLAALLKQNGIKIRSERDV